MYIVLYFVIGLIICMVNNSLFTKLQTEEEKLSENPSMILYMMMWFIFWPLSLVSTFNMVKEYYTRSHERK